MPHGRLQVPTISFSVADSDVHEGWKLNGLLRRCNAVQYSGPCPSTAFILELNSEEKKQFEKDCDVRI